MVTKCQHRWGACGAFLRQVWTIESKGRIKLQQSWGAANFINTHILSHFAEYAEYTHFVPFCRICRIIFRRVACAHIPSFLCYEIEGFCCRSYKTTPQSPLNGIDILDHGTKDAQLFKKLKTDVLACTEQPYPWHYNAVTQSCWGTDWKQIKWWWATSFKKGGIILKTFTILRMPASKNLGSKAIHSWKLFLRAYLNL